MPAHSPGTDLWSRSAGQAALAALLLLLIGSHWDRNPWISVTGLLLGLPASCFILARSWRLSWFRSERTLSLALGGAGLLLTAWVLVAWMAQPVCCPQHRLPGNLAYTWTAIAVGWSAAIAAHVLPRWQRTAALVIAVACTAVMAVVAVMQTFWAWPDPLAHVTLAGRDFSLQSNPMHVAGCETTLFRAYGAASYCIAFGTLSATVLITALYLSLLRITERGRPLLALLATCATLSVILSMSRTAMCCSLAMALCSVPFFRRTASWFVGILVVALAASLLAIQPGWGRDRLFEPEQTRDGGTAAHPVIQDPLERAVADGRWPIWQATFRLIDTSPWTGSGRGDAYANAIASLPLVDEADLREIPCEAHNDLLSAAAFYGLPAALLLAAMLAIVIFSTLRRRPSSAVPVWLAVMAILGLGLTSSPLHQRASALLLFAAIGFLLGLHRIEQTPIHSLLSPDDPLRSRAMPPPPLSARPTQPGSTGAEVSTEDGQA